MDDEIFPLNDEVFNEKAFMLGLLGIGIHDYDEQIKLLQTAKQCAFTTGAKQAVVWGSIGFAAGAVLGVAEVPGAVAGVLTGMIRGTKSCMHAQEIQEVRIFANGQ